MQQVAGTVTGSSTSTTGSGGAAAVPGAENQETRGSRSDWAREQMVPARSVPDAESRPAVQVPCTASDPRHSWPLERALLQRLYTQVGSPRVTVVLWDGTIVSKPQSPIGQIIVGSPSAFRRLIWNPDLAFGECFSSGDLEIDGDLIAVLTELNRGLSRTGSPTRLNTPWRLTHDSHSLAKAKSNACHHYDLGNDFYKLWLDEQLVYSCAYYPHSNATLREAQVAKLDQICRKLRLKAGEHVVDAGCGWGALALHMARNYGVSVQAYNLSGEQVQFARRRADAEGLSNRVVFIEDDYRNLAGHCDAFVSVGMLEHVGPKNYRGLGILMSRALNPTGRGLIQSIGRNAPRPLDAWTEKYIFPGAHPPSLREMMDLFECSGFSVLDVENLRLHYARTCADWLARFELATDRVRQMFDESFVRMWRLYLAASSAAFANGDLQLFQVLFARTNDNTPPWTRADWYRDT